MRLDLTEYHDTGRQGVRRRTVILGQAKVPDSGWHATSIDRPAGTEQYPRGCTTRVLWQNQ